MSDRESDGPYDSGRRSRAGPRLITSHGALLLQLAQDPDVTVEELGRMLAASTRTVRRIITDLEAAAVLTRRREGNRNRYVIHKTRRVADGPAGLTVGEFIDRLSR